jgi:hypothetical protein
MSATDRLQQPLTFDLAELRQRGWGKYAYGWAMCGCNRRYAVRALVAQNGVKQYKIYCEVCGRCCGGAIAHAKLDPLTMEYADRAAFARSWELPACEACGDEVSGVELHHWAPWSVFGEDAMHWPVSYLCRKCHRLWHDKMAANARHAGGTA